MSSLQVQPPQVLSKIFHTSSLGSDAVCPNVPRVSTPDSDGSGMCDLSLVSDGYLRLEPLVKTDRRSCNEQDMHDSDPQVPSVNTGHSSLLVQNLPVSAEKDLSEACCPSGSSVTASASESVQAQSDVVTIFSFHP